MRIFTLAILTLALAGTTATAQPKFSFRNTSTSVAAKVKALKNRSAAERKNQITTLSTTSALWLPAQEEEWIYDGGEYSHEGDYFYTYDERGNKVTEIYDDGFSKTKTERIFNENDKVVSEIDSYSEEDEPYCYSNKRLTTYDSRLTNFIIDSQNYGWTEPEAEGEEGEWVVFNDGHHYKKVLTRNAQGNITGLEIHTYFMDNYELTHRTAITYNESGLAYTWKYEELVYNGIGYTMEEKFMLADMQWYTTDGQIVVINDLEEFFTGNNRLKKATVYQEGEITGNIEAEYQENGDYSYSYIYTTDPYANETYTVTYTDANGSYTKKCEAYEDLNGDQVLTEDEFVYDEEEIITIDQYGRETEAVGYEDGELMGGAKYDYTYSDEYGSYPIEQIHYEYDIDAEEYVPFLKIIAKDFYDVAAIDDINIDSTDAPEEIYNLQGIRIDASSDQLPAGLYLIKQGSKTSKVIKR